MSLFNDIWRRFRFGLRAVKFGPQTFYETLGGLKAASGISVDPVGAMQASALSAGIRVLANALSTVPLKVRRRIEGGQEDAPDHPLYFLLHDSPNVRMTACEWRFDMLTAMILWGHSYAQIVVNGKDQVTAIWPLHPTRVRVKDPVADSLVYVYTRPDGSQREFAEADILHVPYLIEGKSLFEHAREVLGLSLSADQFAARYFSSGGVQPHALKSEQQVAFEKKKEIVDAWHEAQRNGRIPFLDSGADVKDLGSKPAEIQLLEARRFAIEEIGRVLGVPPHLLGALDRATNNNIEHQGIDFVTHGVRPLAVRIEQRLNMHLLGPREGRLFFCEHNLHGLQRGDYKSLAEGSARLVNAAIMTPNDARKVFELPPLDGGDKLYIQGATVPLEMAGQQPANGGNNAGNPDAGTQN